MLMGMLVLLAVAVVDGVPAARVVRACTLSTLCVGGVCVGTNLSPSIKLASLAAVIPPRFCNCAAFCGWNRGACASLRTTTLPCSDRHRRSAGDLWYLECFGVWCASHVSCCCSRFVVVVLLVVAGGESSGRYVLCVVVLLVRNVTFFVFVLVSVSVHLYARRWCCWRSCWLVCVVCVGVALFCVRV